jgi:hypothetical protein
MVTIDRKQIIFSTSFMTANDQEVLIEFPCQNEVIKLAFTFKPGEEGVLQPRSLWTTYDKFVKFTITGWDAFSLFALGPAELNIVVGEKRLYVQFAHHFNVGQHLVHLFVLAGDNTSET